MMYILLGILCALLVGANKVAHLCAGLWNASWTSCELEHELHTELQADKASCKL